jgi:hypothetical protein
MHQKYFPGMYAPNPKIDKKTTGYAATKAYVKPEPKIFDQIDHSNIGILYWHQDTLEKIAELSGPLAKSNEFQIHYWALVARLTFPDNSIVDIAFPTAIYNYAQEVSSAHIDFELKDVNAMSKMLEPVHNVVANKLRPELEKIIDPFGCTVKYLVEPMNTMHRHPTGVSKFSGTDLRKNHEHDTGIVFPIEKGNNTPTFSSIIYNNPVRMVHSEYRTATGDVNTKEGLTYTEGRCVTYIKDDTVKPSLAEQLFNVPIEDLTYVLNPTKLDLYPIEKTLKNISYEPNTQFIKKENVTKKTYTAPTKTVGTTETTLIGDIQSMAAMLNVSKTSEDGLTLVYPKEVKETIKTAFNLTIRDLTELEKMKPKTLKQCAVPLERHYYKDPTIDVTSYNDLSKKEIIEFMMEVQDGIIDDLMEESIDAPAWSEDSSTVTQEEKIELLMMCGAPEADLKAARPETIDKWYEELSIPA